MDRQRAVGAEEPEYALHQARRAGSACRLESGHRRGREGERSFLREAHRLVEGPARLADAGALGMRGLHQAHRLEEVELPWLLAQDAGKLCRDGRCPDLVGHRITSPRPTTSSAVSVKELREACLAKNSSRIDPRRKAPLPSKARSSQVRRTSIPRPNVIGPRPGMRRVIGCTLTARTPSRWRRTTDSLSRA